MLALRFSVRLMLFYVFFELFSFVFSPRVIMLELSGMGLHKLGIITGIAYNQFYYLIDLMYSVWRAIRQRKSGIPFFSDAVLFLRSVLRHSLRRADNIAFSMYATRVFDTMPTHSGIIFKKKDSYLLIHLGVVLAVLAGVLKFS